MINKDVIIKSFDEVIMELDTDVLAVVYSFIVDIDKLAIINIESKPSIDAIASYILGINQEHILDFLYQFSVSLNFNGVINLDMTELQKANSFLFGKNSDILTPDFTKQLGSSNDALVSLVRLLKLYTKTCKARIAVKLNTVGKK